MNPGLQRYLNLLKTEMNLPIGKWNMFPSDTNITISWKKNKLCPLKKEWIKIECTDVCSYNDPQFYLFMKTFFVSLEQEEEYFLNWDKNKWADVFKKLKFYKSDVFI